MTSLAGRKVPDYEEASWLARPRAAIASSSIDVGNVTRVLHQHRQFKADDIVFLGGSVVDGLATPWSDVDVFIIRRIEAAGDIHLVPMPHDEMTIDLEVWPICEVETLLRKLEGIQADAPTDHRAFMRLTEDERDFLHCLVSGIPVHNDDGFRALQTRVNQRLLVKLSVARAMMGIGNSQTDLLGWQATEDWQSATFTSRRLVEFAGLALLGAAESSHPGGKWTTSLLRRQFADIPIPPRLLDGSATLADRYHTLQMSPSTAEATWRLAQECVHFTNIAVIYAQTERGEIADGPLRQLYWSPPPPSPAVDRVFRPELSAAAQIRFNQGTWYLSRVGGEMFEINATAVAMLLLMNGRATEEEILKSLEEIVATDASKMRRSLRDMLLFLDNVRLLVM